MKHIPVNRWTVGAIVTILVVFGGDFVAPILKVMATLSAPYVPAM